MSVSAQEAATYLIRYVNAYRVEYARMIAVPPKGGGYPAFEISPFQYSDEISCWLASDGSIIEDRTRQPSYDWWIAGGPAIKVDYEPTRTPLAITELLRSRGLLGKSIGIYRVVARQELPQEVWNGTLPDGEQYIQTQGGLTAKVTKVMCPRNELLARLTFGALGSPGILDFKLSDASSDFWIPNIIRNMGFLNGAVEKRRFINYLETAPHIELAAWDPRSASARAQSDVRRDFASALAQRNGGSLSFGKGQNPVQLFYGQLSILGSTLVAFAKLLKESDDADEATFHAFLAQNTVLLDVYAEPISKPRFIFPSGQHSATGKSYLEPDFVLKYRDGTYRLVELERPNKPIATQQGQPRAAFTQASFQIAEWRAYIANHYDLLKDRFPGISTSTGAILVIGRSTERAFGSGRNVHEYKATLRTLLSNTEVFTYDELWERANEAYTRLVSLSPHL